MVMTQFQILSQKKRGLMNNTDYSDLISIYGATNVENALIFISNSTDPKGLRVSIPPTNQRVTEVLEAVHGEFLLGGLKLKKYW